MGSTLLGSIRLRDVGNSLTKMGQSIHNVRRGALANRVRADYGNPASQSIMGGHEKNKNYQV